MTDAERSFLGLALQVLATLFVAYALIVAFPTPALRDYLKDKEHRSVSRVLRLCYGATMLARFGVALLGGAAVVLVTNILRDDALGIKIAEANAASSVNMVSSSIFALVSYVIAVEWFVRVIFPRLVERSEEKQMKDELRELEQMSEKTRSAPGGGDSSENDNLADDHDESEAGAATFIPNA